MAATDTGKTNKPVLRSISPSGRFCNSRLPPAFYSSSVSNFASSTSSFSSRSNTFFHRSISPTRVYLYGSTGSVIPSVRFALDRCSISPNKSISVNTGTGSGQVAKRQSHRHQKRTCMCSPTTHPGSFRCSLHKSFGSSTAARYSPHRHNARRSAMSNSLVRIRGVEGELVKRALAALIRPSSHHQRRRCDFWPRRSRLCVMSKAEEDS